MFGAFLLYGVYGYIIIGIPVVLVCFIILYNMIRNHKYELEYYKKKALEDAENS